jgi:hypothetical protein
MKTWDAGTHMSKPEWRRACERVQNRLQNLDVRNAGATPAKSGRREGAAKSDRVTN